jgi:type IV secretion system protein VirB10
MGNEQFDEKLLKEDVAKQKMTTRTEPRPASKGLSKSLKKVAVGAAAAITGAIVFGIMTAGNKGSKSEQADTLQASDAGQTKPAITTFMHNGSRKQAAESGIQTVDGSGSATAVPSPGPDHIATGLGKGPSDRGLGNRNRKELTETEKYRKWKQERYFKSLEDADMAAQKAQEAKPVASNDNMRGNEGSAAGVPAAGQQPGFLSVSDGLNKLQDMAIAKAGAQETGANSPQGENKAFMKDQSKEQTGYLADTVHAAAGQHEIFAGSVIPAIMLTGIDSDLPGTISAQVRQTVYDSLNPDIVLIPQGAHLVGQYSSGVQYGQKRVLVAWSQLIFPNGSTIDLRGMSGTDGEGQAGFNDLVDNHFLRIFGSAFLLSILGVGAQLSQPQNSSILMAPTVGQQAAGAMAQELNIVGTNLMNQNLSIQPTLQIRPGYAFNVLVNKTMIMPSYE